MRSTDPALHPRRVLPLVLEWMQDDPVILLEGPRSVGKSTLLRQIAATNNGILLDLDDPATRDAVTTDPGLYTRSDRLICIDEYQKAPIILDAVKAELNNQTTPGRFILAGSARHDTLPAAAQALTGRLSRLDVLPLSQGELDQTPKTFLDSVLEEPTSVVTSQDSAATRQDYINRIMNGGFPLAIAASTPAARRRWIDEYLRLSLERDVRDLSNLRQGHLLSDLLDALAGQTAQILNVGRVARKVGLDKATADSYISLLEKVFLIHRLPAWGKTLTARSAATPKIHMIDSAIAARLLRLSPEKLASLDPTAQTEFGHLVETFAINELLKQTSWCPDATGVGHWRTHDGLEVDLVIELDDGGVLGFEIKSSGRVPGNDLTPLKKLRDAIGPNFRAGYALHLGERSYTFDDRVHVLPLDRLWS